MSEKDMLSTRTEFEHSCEQECYEWIPSHDGITFLEMNENGKSELERTIFSIQELSYNIEGSASSRANMNILYTCTFKKCIIHCPCCICRDTSENCKA